MLEHQSTIDENMPLRMLYFITEIYKERGSIRSLYTKNRLPLPRPEFIVLYNGVEEMEDRRMLKLSDMFIGQSLDDNIITLELTVKMYNINAGKNVEMLDRCEALYGYSTFVSKAREFHKVKKMTPEDAIKQAVIYCIDNNILSDFFNIHKKEIINMFTVEWDQDTAIAVAQEDGEARGWARGWARGATDSMVRTARVLRAKGLDVNAIAEATGLTVDDVLRLD